MKRRLSGRDNIVLIGMPGVGKSTAGVLLAKASRRQFIDTDVMIQVRQGRGLQEIIDTDGLEAFQRLEEQAILGLRLQRHVIATGGSVVYSVPAMGHLRAGGPLIHLDLPLADIVERIDNLDVRGLVMTPCQTLADLYGERRDLYQRWADMTIDCSGLTQDQVVAAILARLEL